MKNLNNQNTDGRKKPEVGFVMPGMVAPSVKMLHHPAGRNYFKGV